MWSYNYNKTSNEMYHWGIKGMRKGIRRFQNPDGTLTEEGKLRYGIGDTPLTKEDVQAREAVIKSENEAEIIRKENALREEKIREEQLKQEANAARSMRIKEKTQDLTDKYQQMKYNRIAAKEERNKRRLTKAAKFIAGAAILNTIITIKNRDA